jgi:hypothetical protein
MAYRKEGVMSKGTVAFFAVLVVAGLAAIGGIARATDGGPLVLGQQNEAISATSLSVSGNNGLVVTTTQGDGQALAVSQDGDGQAVHAEIGSGANGCALCAFALQGGNALFVDGRSSFNGPIFSKMSGVSIVPAGARSVTVSVSQLRGQERVLATLQGATGRTGVASVANHPAAGTITIFLTQTAPKDVKVAWFMFAFNT